MKIYKREQLSKVIENLKQQGNTIGFANGCFDIIHVGHIRYLKEAKENCDFLIVALNTDDSVRKLKGEGRPTVSLNERMEIIEALECVDFVVSFSELTVIETLKILKPHIQFKGTDYTEETVPEKEIMKQLEGKVMITGDPKDHSTTEIIEKLKDN